MADFRWQDDLEVADRLGLEALELVETVQAMRAQAEELEAQATALPDQASELRKRANQLSDDAGRVENDYFEAQRQYEGFVLEHGDTIERLLQERAKQEHSASQDQATGRRDWGQDQDWRGVHKGTLEMRDRWNKLDAERQQEAQNNGQSL